MYTTKVFNAKVAESYLNIGDPYAKQMTADGRSHGKQFLTNPGRVGQLHGYFSPFSYQTESYQDSNKYIVTQPRENRKLGFGTHDANRRDEFTLDIRAKQYRETIDLEKQWEKDGIERRGRARSAPERDLNSTSDSKTQQDALDEFAKQYFQNNIPSLQYDIGRTKEGLTPSCAKCKHDTFYCVHRLSLMEGTCLRRKDGRTHYSEEFASSIKLPQQRIVRNQPHCAITKAAAVAHPVPFHK